MNTIEFIYWLNVSFFKIWVILSNCRQYQMHLFFMIWIFIFWVMLEYNRFFVALGLKVCFPMEKNKSRVNVLITFRAVESPGIVSSNRQNLSMLSLNVAWFVYFCAWRLVLESFLFSSKRTKYRFSLTFHQYLHFIVLQIL